MLRANKAKTQRSQDLAVTPDTELNCLHGNGHVGRPRRAGSLSVRPYPPRPAQTAPISPHQMQTGRQKLLASYIPHVSLPPPLLCRQNFNPRDFKQCPFNARHIVPKLEFEYHIQICDDRGRFEAEQLQGSQPPQPFSPLLKIFVPCFFSSDPEGPEFEGEHLDPGL